MRESIVDFESNLEFNRRRWGDALVWQDRDRYGYRWGGGIQQTTGGMARFADSCLKPYLGNRYDYEILEIAPGAGRFTAELIRYAGSIDLLDMNQACLDICRERFKYYPVEIGYFLNDGQSCEVLGCRFYNLIACFDAMVHMHPVIIEGYVKQLAGHLREGGLMWLDHSGGGAREVGHRTDMTAERMAEIGLSYGLNLVAQEFRNDYDCITIFRKGRL